jgi:hypothetical protein
MIKYIFLDMDGVLNDHTNRDNNYCGTNQECIKQFNRLLELLPDAQIVVSSAWRYMILRHAMTLKGFEYLLLTHGVNCHDRVCGHTREDKDVHESRICQILDWLQEHDPECNDWISLDDLDFGDQHCYRVDGNVGLTSEDVTNILMNARIV